MKTSEPPSMDVPTQQAKAPSAAACKKLNELWITLRAPTVAFELWEKVLSPRDRARLDDNREKAYLDGGPIRMWVKLHGCTVARAVVDLAFKLNLLTQSDRQWLLSETGELLDAEAAYEDAIERNHLVLNSLTREIYWKGTAIEVDWTHEAKWSFMWELARHAKTNLPIDRFTFGEQRKSNYVSKAKHELTKMEEFPDELAVLIEVAGKGTQKLNLPPEQIRLFEQQVSSEIVEWTP